MAEKRVKKLEQFLEMGTKTCIHTSKNIEY